jgi:hypothetical protein
MGLFDRKKSKKNTIELYAEKLKEYCESEEFDKKEDAVISITLSKGDVNTVIVGSGNNLMKSLSSVLMKDEDFLKMVKTTVEISEKVTGMSEDDLSGILDEVENHSKGNKRSLKDAFEDKGNQKGSDKDQFDDNIDTLGE